MNGLPMAKLFPAGAVPTSVYVWQLGQKKVERLLQRPLWIGVPHTGQGWFCRP